MRTIFAVAAMLIAAALASAAPAFAQEPSSTLKLTLDDAVRMALENNVDLAVDRLEPQSADTRVATAKGFFKPSFTTGVNQNNQLQPPSSFLIPTPTRTDAVTSSAGVTQQLPWFGTAYTVSWNAVHTTSNSFLTSYNPLLQSGLQMNLSQPLLRNLFVDAARQQLATTRIARDVADTRLRESLVHTTANTKAAYWNLVSAIANVEARTSALNLAQELVRVNKAKVDVGQSPPLDLVSAQAEVAADQEQVIVAETAVRQAEDKLRMMIFDAADRAVWNVRIEPVDSPPVVTTLPNVDAAVTRALAERADLARARKDIETAHTTVKYTNNQRLPDVRLNASYQASGLGGTQVLRAGGFPGTILGPGAVTDFGSVLSQLFAHDYPTWAVGVSVSYPIGQSSDEANFARARIEETQADKRLRSAEARAIQEVRNAGWQIDMNGKRIETARAARELAEQRLDTERKRLDVGLSTSFLVIQAQRDLAQAKANELEAVLGYDLALVDFEALQQAGPQTGQQAPAGGASALPAAVAAPAVTAAPNATRPAAITAIPGVF